MTSDRISGAVLMLFGLLAATQATSYPVGSLTDPGPGFLPLIFALLVSGCGLLVVVTAAPARLTRRMFEDAGKVALVTAGLIFAAIAMERLGYRLTIAILLFYYLAAIERRNLMLSFAVALFMAFGSYHLFANWLYLRLPVGFNGI